MNKPSGNVIKCGSVILHHRILVALSLVAGISIAPRAQVPLAEAPVRNAVEAFYAAFNSDDFRLAAEFTAADWNHINPGGGWTQGRVAVLKEVEEVHRTFLKGVGALIDSMIVRFVTPDVAIATVIEHFVGTYVLPDGVDRGTNRHEHERHVKTYVIAKRDGHWVIVQDQYTTMP
jgi:uncharacterized protein (TIGR02246 family)